MYKQFLMPFFWLALAFIVVCVSIRVYAETRQEFPIGPLGYNHWFVDVKGKGPSYDEHEKLTNPPHQVAVVSKEIKQLPKVTTIDRPFDPVKFSKAVAKHETSSCTKGYGKQYNNCVGMKNGRIAPCKKIGRNRMCIYDTPEESLVSFRKVWEVGYGNKFPTKRMAEVYSGSDRSNIWLANVTKFYEEQF